MQRIDFSKTLCTRVAGYRRRQRGQRGSDALRIGVRLLLVPTLRRREQPM